MEYNKTMIEKVRELLEHGNYIAADVDYDRIYHCTYDDEDSCDSICRCSTIENIEIKKIEPMHYLAKYCMSKNKITEYCLERLFCHHKLYDVDNWTYSIDPGYYGEELGPITLYSSNKKQEIINTVEKFLGSSDIDNIKYLLTLEYGYLIKNYNSCKIISININEIEKPDIVVKYEKYFDTEYKKRTLPIALCEKRGPLYKIIDGHHRYTYSKSKNQETVDIIVLE